jgi:hypothetical protein
MFISILYMFRSAMCPSSGELIVSIRHMVYVTLYRCAGGIDVHMVYVTLYRCEGGIDVHMVYVTLYRCAGGIDVHMVYVTLYRCAGLDETASHPNLHTKQSSIQSDIYQISY